MNDDIEDVPGGIDAEIGEKGVNMSGGQKARLGLARALYREADIYLLDDVLSAVDMHVGRAIIDRCLLGQLKGKTRLLVTHNLSVCRHADAVWLLKDGRIAQQGTFQEISKKPQFEALYQSFMKKEEVDVGQQVKLA